MAALEALEGGPASALLPDPRLQPLLQPFPGSAPDPALAPPPATMPALGWHEAAVACVRIGDLARLALIAGGLFSGQIDDSRILAHTPLALTVAPPAPQLVPARHGAQSQQAGCAAGGEASKGSECDTGGGGDGCLPGLLGAASTAVSTVANTAATSGLGGLFGSQSVGSGRPPMMNQWCVLGPASFISFGLWSLSALLQLCTVRGWACVLGNGGTATCCWQKAGMHVAWAARRAVWGAFLLRWLSCRLPAVGATAPMKMLLEHQARGLAMSNAPFSTLNCTPHYITSLHHIISHPRAQSE